MKMSKTRAERRKKEIARSKERTELRRKMGMDSFDTEDGLKIQTKIAGEVRYNHPRGSWNK